VVAAVASVRLYQRATGDHEYGRQKLGGIHLTRGGDNREAADLIRSILANDQPAVTAHDYATKTLGAALPDRVCSVVERRAAVTCRRNGAYQAGRRKGKTLRAAWTTPESTTSAEN
jgi:hypothetical protein